MFGEGGDKKKHFLKKLELGVLENLEIWKYYISFVQRKKNDFAKTFDL